MHTVFALLCHVVVIHWLIFTYPSGLLHWHCGNLTIAPMPAKQPWWIWINTSCEFIMNDCITTTKHSTTKPCAYFLGYTVVAPRSTWLISKERDDVMTRKHYWSCMGGIHRPPVDSPHKGQITWSFEVFFTASLKTNLSALNIQSSCRLCNTLWHSFICGNTNFKIVYWLHSSMILFLWHHMAS